MFSWQEENFLSTCYRRSALVLAMSHRLPLLLNRHKALYCS